MPTIRKGSGLTRQRRRVSEESFEELFERAKADALQLIASFRDAITGRGSLKDAIGGISFLTGVPVEE